MTCRFGGGHRLAALAGAVIVGLWGALAGPGAGPASAETRVVPDSRAAIQLSFAPLVKRAAPAVVNIYTRRTVETRVSPLLSDPFFRQFFGDRFMPPGFAGPSQRRVQNSLGSGVLVAADGLVVTNHHVVEGSDQITVVLADRREFEATVMGSDERTDLAILRIDTGGEALPYLSLGDSDDLEVGDLVLAIGNPFGVGQTVTSGIVSALSRTTIPGAGEYRAFIQTDAAVNPGNSGGALVTMDGALVGINTAIFSRSGGSHGIGFAIPANMVSAVVAGLREDGRIVRPWLGAQGQTVTADLASGLGLGRPGGVLVNRVHPDSAAAEAGLRVGDVILEVGGHEVADAASLRFRVATLRLGDSVELAVLRNGAQRSLRLPLQAPPEDPPRDTTTVSGRNPFSGATLANLSPALAEELALNDIAPEGVIVLDVSGGSIAGRVGVRPGDVLLEVNGRRVDSVRGLQGSLEPRGGGWRVQLRRDGEVVTFSVSA